MAANLKRFEVDASGKHYAIRVEDDQGNVLELIASRDQLDVIADSLDDILLADDAADEVEE